jgi:hypothetical protein
MDNSDLLVIAMAEECQRLIKEWDRTSPDLPKALQPKHLLWMCRQIVAHAESGPAAKLHRWLGFVQCGMMANRMLDLDGVRAMFDKAKGAHGDTGDDLSDHLDITSSFKLDIGGES